ncbi:hypothetical protein AAZX31_06G056600 [Glycine max]|uniref:Uncharacterized protein n=2 Tax=Glycine subgen. Soja TaxID=1462606 RepID=C6T255_SOYBN|nr:uncharacterized protein LOC100500572 [Glycine max]XP_028235141.1 protein GLUTAMINE DUMPER 5-like [Glycine soja]ACU15688.1 unknown [Glycine max]KAG5018548.1 hypothetical protein JHK87_014403 [Glycine soja]KAG5030887.1 hypothetical protein JHK85_014869 [Glycine max]KAG5045113.1 hypothetical protein JHK86_014519 [Glycine max]KAG5147611.1 hypothetical protein JHK82_014492 [Glycine max]|eukprot:NP_001236266.1 uncharacterized protein LOC100500572 [Glycine max]
MRTIPTTTSTTIAPTATTSSLTTSPSQHSSTWHSPVPYLFGGLAAMLGLIAFALLILACSYWKLSGQLQNEENAERDLESVVGGEKQGDSANKESVTVYEEKILVIMAGDEKPTFLATPKASSFVPHGVPNHFEENLENHVTSEKSEKNHVQQPTSPQQQSQPRQ